MGSIIDKKGGTEADVNACYLYGKHMSMHEWGKNNIYSAAEDLESMQDLTENKYKTF